MNLNYAPTHFLFLTKCLFKWGYNSTKSVVSIHGFVDMGGECRKIVVGDHVFVFIYSFLAYIWRKLRGEGFKYLIPRNFNQDPLKNFFRGIRCYGGRAINPIVLPLLLLLKLFL